MIKFIDTEWDVEIEIPHTDDFWTKLTAFEDFCQKTGNSDVFEWGRNFLIMYEPTDEDDNTFFSAKYSGNVVNLDTKK